MGTRKARKSSSAAPEPAERKTIVEYVGPYPLSLGYSGDRLISASGKGRRYRASLTLQPELPRGSFSNGYGDSILWANGVEVSDAVYGGFETTQTRKISYGEWVQQMLELIRAGLLHDGRSEASP